MKQDRRRSENEEIRLTQKTNEALKKERAKERKQRAKERKRENSKFRNSAFGKRWFALKKWQRALVYIALVLVLLALAGFLTVYGAFSKVQNKVDEDKLGISKNIEEKYGKSEIVNIALFGVDTRDENSFTGRSDTIMIASVDKATGSIKLTSVLRDSEVKIEGHKPQKIAHAYALGGPELAIKTLNQNFNMNITDYATVNFTKLGEAIDVVGGVDVDITEKERKHINDIGDDSDGSFPYIAKSGVVHLNGKQAVVYARIRKLDSDTKRVERQKAVLEQVIAKAKKISPSRYGEMVRVGMSLCETSLSFSEIMSFAPMLSKDIHMTARVVPSEEEHPQSGTFNGVWLWRYDLNLAAEHIHEFIYGEAPDASSVLVENHAEDNHNPEHQKPDRQKDTASPKHDKNSTKKPSKNTDTKTTTVPQTKPDSAQTTVKPQTEATTKAPHEEPKTELPNPPQEDKNDKPETPKQPNPENAA